MNILINVSPFTKRILEKRYRGPEPYTIHRRDILNKRLWFDSTAKYRPYKLSNSILTETIELNVNQKLYRHLIANRRYSMIGLYLHSEFKNEMCAFILGRAMGGDKPKLVLREYLDLMGISEQDFPVDTAYKEWKRYKSEFFEKFQEILRNFGDFLSLGVRKAKTSC